MNILNKARIAPIVRKMKTATICWRATIRNLLSMGGLLISSIMNVQSNGRLDQQKKQKSLMKSMYIQQDLLGATFQQVDISDPSRLAMFQHVTDFLKSYNETGKGKGLYLYGKFGVGKTFMLAAIANEPGGKRVLLHDCLCA